MALTMSWSSYMCGQYVHIYDVWETACRFGFERFTLWLQPHHTLVHTWIIPLQVFAKHTSHINKCHKLAHTETYNAQRRHEFRNQLRTEEEEEEALLRGFPFNSSMRIIITTQYYGYFGVYHHQLRGTAQAQLTYSLNYGQLILHLYIQFHQYYIYARNGNWIECFAL